MTKPIDPPAEDTTDINWLKSWAKDALFNGSSIQKQAGHGVLTLLEIIDKADDLRSEQQVRKRTLGPESIGTPCLTAAKVYDRSRRKLVGG